MRMNKRIKEMWVEALRSGKFKKAEGKLARRRPVKGDYEDTFCALGVLCELAVAEGVVTKEYNFARGYYIYHGSEGLRSANGLPYAVQQWAGLNSDNPGFELLDGTTSVAGINDTPDKYGPGFDAVADLIQEQL